MGKNDGFYQSNDWKKNGAEDYLQGLRALRPDIQRRAAELLATLGPSISKVEDGFSKTHGWTPDKSTRVWETNPAYAKHADKFKGVVPGSPPKPHSPDFGKQFFDPDLIGKARGGPVNYAKGGAVGHPSAHIALVSDLRKTAKDHGFQKPAMTHLIKMMGIPNPRASVYAQNVLNDPQLHNKINPVTEKFLITLHGAMKHTAAQKHTGELRRHLRDRVIYGNP
jgi:hypothetical protein